MPHLIFDVETTDLPNFSAAADEQTARICELAALLVDSETLEPIGEPLCELILPNGWEIQPGAAEVNKITMEDCHKHGRPIAEVIAEFDAMQDRATVLVGWSMRFDLKFVRGERRRLGLRDRFGELPELDGMYAANPFTDCKSEKTGRKIMPSLAAAYEQLVGKPMPDAHTALGDVEATADVLRVLRKTWNVDIAGKVPVSSAEKPPAKAKRATKPAIIIDPNDPQVF